MYIKHILLSGKILFLALLIISCSSNKSIPSKLSNKISPNMCRINGTIISIEEITETFGPCSIKPCVAKVKIKDILGTGSGFTTPLIKGNSIKLKFAFTLSKTTKELFPTLTDPFPGLTIGDSFTGDIEKIEVIQLANNSTENEYITYIYDKID